MIHHKLRLLRELPILVIISRLPNGIAFVYLRGLAALGSDVRAVDLSSRTVVVAQFIEELAFQFRLESGVAEVAHAKTCSFWYGALRCGRRHVRSLLSYQSPVYREAPLEESPVYSRGSRGY